MEREKDFLYGMKINTNSSPTKKKSIIMGPNGKNRKEMNKSQFYENTNTEVQLTTNNGVESPDNMKRNNIANFLSVNNHFKSEYQKSIRSPLKPKMKKAKTREKDCDKDREKDELLMSPKLKKSMSKSRSTRKLINAQEFQKSSYNISLINTMNSNQYDK